MKKLENYLVQVKSGESMPLFSFINEDVFRKKVYPSRA